jgi:hypothetical protein
MHPEDRGLARPSPTAQLAAMDAFLRLGLALVIVYLLFLSVRMVIVSGGTASNFLYRPEKPAAAVSAMPPAPAHGQRFDANSIPFPLYPGAQDVDGFSMQFNGGDFFRCEYYTVADAPTVLRYYRSWLLRRGWYDWVQEAFRRERPAIGQLQGVPADLQNESMLRFYDRMQREQLNCARGQERLAVVVKRAEGRPFGTQVALQYTERSDVEALGQGKAGRSLLTFGQDLGDDRFESRVVHSKRRERDLFASMMGSYRREGWRPIEFPESMRQRQPEYYAQLVRGGETLLINVQPDSNQKGSVAVVTRMSSTK